MTSEIIANEKFDFGEVVLNEGVIASFVQQFLAFGSKAKRILKSDVIIFPKANGAPYTSVQDMLNNGNYLFNALIFATSPEHKGFKQVQKPENFVSPDNDIATLAEGIFCLYFYVFTQGDAPSPALNVMGPQVPNFLRGVIKMRHPPGWHMKNLASFDLRMMEHRWIRGVNIDGLSREAQQRFGLGIAGYRMFSMFKDYPLKEGATPEAERAHKIIKDFLNSGTYWEIHPAFRPPEIIERLGSINGVLGNLILACFEDSDIESAKVAKLIYSVPVYSIRHDTYKRWKPDVFSFAKSPVFPHHD
jgi:hypothetical protein